MEKGINRLPAETFRQMIENDSPLKDPFYNPRYNKRFRLGQDPVSRLRIRKVILGSTKK